MITLTGLIESRNASERQRPAKYRGHFIVLPSGVGHGRVDYLRIRKSLEKLHVNDGRVGDLIALLVRAEGERVSTTVVVRENNGIVA
ncbi:hypothetical protein [Amycolatopsis dendrobii]|uniref:Uncharacterized protein n=1 Tax=Amycolatopsis dendrobii TaxID=2760662 RepID=A0A7W3ZA30_9PSEU|nr:hypothetical protein [Amycolatopsis dendrobii]MBB1153477.1 hypothetical protein [Amycolatopsis dendrobii]